MKKLLIPLVAALLLTGCATRITPDPLPTDPTEPTKITTAPPTRPPVEAPEVEEVPVVEDTLFDPWACEDLFGQWTLNVTISSDYFKIENFTGTATFPLTWSFSEDGRYTVTVEQDSFGSAIVGYETELADFMISARYNKFVAEKKISALTDKEIESRWDTSERDKVQKEIHGWLDDMTLGASFGALVRAGYYYVEDDIVYLSIGEDEYESFRFTVDEEGLILSNSSRIRFYNNLCIRFPSVLKPQ